MRRGHNRASWTIVAALPALLFQSPTGSMRQIAYAVHVIWRMVRDHGRAYDASMTDAFRRVD